jgi:uncharacterized membrane protein YfhO
MPRVWLVPRVVQLNRKELFTSLMKSKMPDGSIFNPTEIALVEESYALEVHNYDRSANARLINFSHDSLKIRTNSSTPAFLILSDVYYPGWKAAIDNKSVHIFQTDYVLRGVEVPAGNHIVQFDFKPESFKYGTILTILSLIILSGIILKMGKQ